MRSFTRWALVITLLLAAAGAVWAQDGYRLGRYSAEHSGALAAGGGYVLVAAVGQADAGGAGAAVMSGGGFVLAGGFLVGTPIAGGPEPPRAIYLPQVER